MKSKLASNADRSIRHLRWSQTSDGWGGDEEVTLAELDAELPGRLEWVEGLGDNWQIWVFASDADVMVDDVLLFEDVGLALVVGRVAEFTKLKGTFHHFEIFCKEAEWSLGQYVGALP